MIHFNSSLVLFWYDLRYHGGELWQGTVERVEYDSVQNRIWIHLQFSSGMLQELWTHSAGLSRLMLMCTADLLWEENKAQEAEIIRE
jgi:hypothetical protein